MTHFLAVDIETTGLEIGEDLILEIAWCVLDPDMRAMMDVTSSLVSTPYEAMPRLQSNQTVYDMHAASGLIADYFNPARERVWLSTLLREIQNDLANALPVGAGKPVLLGSSPQFDRLMLDYHSDGAFSEITHYRNHDVRALQQTAESAGLSEHFQIPDSPRAHRAADDVGWSIEYAQNFRDILRSTFP